MVVNSDVLTIMALTISDWLFLSARTARARDTFAWDITISTSFSSTPVSSTPSSSSSSAMGATVCKSDKQTLFIVLLLTQFCKSCTHCVLFKIGKPIYYLANKLNATVIKELKITLYESLVLGREATLRAVYRIIPDASVVKETVTYKELLPNTECVWVAHWMA